jgi:hypothetical protein
LPRKARLKLCIAERRFRVGWDACKVDIERHREPCGFVFCHIPMEVS